MDWCFPVSGSVYFCAQHRVCSEGCRDTGMENSQVLRKMGHERRNASFPATGVCQCQLCPIRLSIPPELLCTGLKRLTWRAGATELQHGVTGGCCLSEFCVFPLPDRLTPAASRTGGKGVYWPVGSLRACNNSPHEERDSFPTGEAGRYRREGKERHSPGAHGCFGSSMHPQTDGHMQQLWHHGH